MSVDRPAPKSLAPVHQSTLRRLIMFGIGGVLSYALNTAVFMFLRWELGPEKDKISYAISLTIMSVVTYSWSYFVNFKTARTLQSSLPRYLTAIALSYVMNYVLAQIAFNIWPDKPKLIILVVMAIIAGFKFAIYHYWVFPQHKGLDPLP